MIAPLLFAMLVLVVTFLQSTQGLFSALIMTVLTICSAAGAIGCHEWVAVNWIAPMWRADYANAVALAACFGVPLIVLRLAADKLIRRSAMMPALVEKIGGGFCGLITGLTTVGLLAHAVQMVPFKGSILGYSRVPTVTKEAAETGVEPPSPEALTKQNDLWFQEDRFAVGFASLVSSGIFANENPLYEIHPDRVTAVGWLNAVPSEVSRFASPGSISVVRTETLPFVYEYRPPGPRGSSPAEYEGVQPSGGSQFQMVRVRLGRDARDERKSFSFSLRQFRLVGHTAGQGLPVQYFPIAIQQEDVAQPVNRHIRSEWSHGKKWPIVDNVYEPRPGNNNEVEVVFELPTDFSPRFIEYKGHARAKLTSFDPPGADTTTDTDTAVTKPAENSAPATPAAAPTDEKKDSPRRGRRSRRSRRSNRGNADETAPSASRGGNVRGATTLRQQSFFGDDLPFTMQAYRQLKNAQVSGSLFKSGHLVGFTDEQAEGTQDPLAKFDVPSDLRLLHLHVRNLQARSSIGRALSFAVTTLQNYFVEDENGNRYKIIGKYTVASVDGREVVEIQYFPEPAGSIGGLGDFDKIKDRHLKGKNEFVFLFLTKPGAKITAFSTGGSATRRDDLRGENLIAPS